MFDYLLLDGNNTAFRANCVTDLSNPAGLRISAVFGFLRILKNLLEKFNPDNLIVCWDGGRSVIRKSLYPEYKQRPVDDSPEKKAEIQDFYRQLTVINDMLSMLGICQIKIKGVEADDIIAYICKRNTNIAKSTIIVSTDNDFCQLANYFTVLYNPISDCVLDEDEIYKKYCITVSQFIFYKCLIGDGSDNINGIYGIGSKTAVSLLSKYGDIDTMLSEISKIPESLRSKKLSAVFAGCDILKRNKLLMDLNNLDTSTYEIIEKEFNSIMKKSLDQDRFQKFLLSNGFSSVLAGYNSWILPFIKLNAKSYL